MRYTSRIRSLQRRLKEPWTYDESDPRMIALFEAVFGEDPEPPDSDPPAPGTRLFALRIPATKNPHGQKAPETDTFSIRPLLTFARRLIARPTPILANHG